jgi:hypothetical protein
MPICTSPLAFGGDPPEEPMQAPVLAKRQRTRHDDGSALTQARYFGSTISADGEGILYGDPATCVVPFVLT